MAPQPAPGSGAPPTGNALSDANSQPTLTPAQLQAVGIGLSGTTTSQGSDCLWPPPGMFGIGTGLFSLALGVPCLFTKSEARAVIGAAALIGGLIIVNAGVGLLVGAEAIGLAIRLVGGKSGKAPAGGAAAEGASAPAELALAA